MTRDELLQAIAKAAKEGATTLDLTESNISSDPSDQLTALPPEIGQLTHLETLIVQNLCGANALQTLPPEIGQLKNLQVLDLRSDEL
ncbi:MAG: leucine-rich repeat domain-containing protein, partial [Cyanobacteria bacterium P01_D01_bin.115]